MMRPEDGSFHFRPFRTSATPERAILTAKALGENSMPPTTTTGRNTITLVHVFQIVTGCCLFFACMRFSPLLAILITVVVTPAIIRTGLITSRMRDADMAIGLRSRIKIFIGSVLVNLMTMATCVLVFLLVSVMFGLICVLIALATTRANDLLADIGFIGTLGGTIWGGAAGMLSLTWTQRLWRLPALQSSMLPESAGKRMAT